MWPIIDWRALCANRALLLAIFHINEDYFQAVECIEWKRGIKSCKYLEMILFQLWNFISDI